MMQRIWAPIKLALSDKTALGLKLLFIFMVVYIISTGADHHKIKLFLCVSALFLVVIFIKKITQPLLWYLFLIILISDLICDYFVRANHHFLMIYVTILIIIYLQNSKLEYLITNIKLLLFIVLLFSGIQKLLSTQFMSGDFYYYMINTGKFFKPVWYFNSEMYDIISINNEKIAEVSTSNPNDVKGVTFQNVIPHLDIISRYYAWFSIAMELVTGIFILWKPKHLFTHILFVLLILGILFTRLESGFMALLAISGIWLSDNSRIRGIYTALIIICLSLIITKVGFY